MDPDLATLLARWESTTLETMGPIVSAPAYTALFGALLNLRHLLGVAEAPTITAADAASQGGE